ncbi:hypothetical protein DYB35_012326 [Aphanomyces astaci]|uniref:Uncharacterized protein n=1 Tax=Aphanomyces astaci TaxID=112090 RepID=A0A3R7ALB7_APHAT|nr:hypothetical protein DYB35_012326 [Aphanomyces astaci]
MVSAATSVSGSTATDVLDLVTDWEDDDDDDDDESLAVPEDATSLGDVVLFRDDDVPALLLLSDVNMTTAVAMPPAMSNTPMDANAIFITLLPPGARSSLL